MTQDWHIPIIPNPNDHHERTGREKHVEKEDDCIWAKSCSTKPYYIRVDTRDEFIFRTKFSQHHLSCGGGMLRIKV